MNTKKYVILLHGIMRTSKDMLLIDNLFKKNNYHTLNINYPSTTYDFDTLSENIWNDHIKDIQDDNTEINFVGYSMGGILAKLLVDKYKPKNLKKVVLLGAPIHGSEAADFYKNFKIYQRLLGPSGQQLGTSSNIFKDSPHKLDYDLGCIASDIPTIVKIFYPTSYFIIKGPSDGRVSVKSTMVNGMKEHIVLKLPHFFLPFSKKVRHYILSFITNSTFNYK